MDNRDKVIASLAKERDDYKKALLRMSSTSLLYEYLRDVSDVVNNALLRDELEEQAFHAREILHKYKVRTSSK